MNKYETYGIILGISVVVLFVGHFQQYKAISYIMDREIAKLEWAIERAEEAEASLILNGDAFPDSTMIEPEWIGPALDCIFFRQDGDGTMFTYSNGETQYVDIPYDDVQKVIKAFYILDGRVYRVHEMRCFTLTSWLEDELTGGEGEEYKKCSTR